MRKMRKFGPWGGGRPLDPPLSIIVPNDQNNSEIHTHITQMERQVYTRVTMNSQELRKEHSFCLTVFHLYLCIEKRGLFENVDVLLILVGY